MGQLKLTAICLVAGWVVFAAYLWIFGVPMFFIMFYVDEEPIASKMALVRAIDERVEKDPNLPEELKTELRETRIQTVGEARWYAEESFYNDFRKVSKFGFVLLAVSAMVAWAWHKFHPDPLGIAK